MDATNDGRMSAPRLFNMDQARIDQAARARGILAAVAADGDLVETLCAGVLDLQAENKKLVDQVAALEAELKAVKVPAKET